MPTQRRARAVLTSVSTLSPLIVVVAQIAVEHAALLQSWVLAAAVLHLCLWLEQRRLRLIACPW
jgi:hypothetical protein